MRGYTQAEFARVCDIGYSSLCKYETGLSIPDTINIHKISKSLNISINYLKV